MVVSSFAIGALAYPVFYLGFIDTVLIILFVNLLGVISVCFFSTFGPRFGLRQMVLSRFFFGYYGVKISKYSFQIEFRHKISDLPKLPSLTSSPASVGLPSMSLSVPNFSMPSIVVCQDG